MEALAGGTPAPPFALAGADGKSYSLAEGLKQGPVLLAFFKVSCPVCQFTFPFLERIHKAVAAKGNVQLWGVSQDDAADTRDYARQYGCTFPMLLDDSRYTVSNAYGLTNVPTLFLVQPAAAGSSRADSPRAGQPDGTIQLTSVGFDRRDIEKVAAEFARLTGQRVSVFSPADNVPDYKPG
jgi:peroxiredoxin